MENNENMNRPSGSADAPVSRNWLPIVIVIAIVAIGLVAWGMSRNDDAANDMAGTDANMTTEDQENMMAEDMNGNADMNQDMVNDTNGEMDHEMGVNSGLDNEANVNMQHSLPTGTVIPPMREENGVKVITVVAGDFYFGPGEIRVKKGDKVKIVLDNKKGFHDFVIDEFNVKTKQQQGPVTEEVTFTADKAGTFEYYCSVGQHRQMGMKGKLIVE